MNNLGCYLNSPSHREKQRHADSVAEGVALDRQLSILIFLLAIEQINRFLRIEVQTTTFC